MADRQQTDHLLLLAAGLFALLGFAAMLLTAYFQWRAIHRLTEISMALPVRGLGQLPSVDTLDLNGNQLLTASASEESNNRLFNVIERLETRIAELEEAARSPLKEHASDSVPPIAGHNAETSELLLGQGQSLLNSNQPEEAIVCFDKILAMNANNVEALVKKGSALEKLRKPTEAIECYDRAIAADSSLTIAYLQKGGLYNRMERFNDAMKCYEQALHAGEKTQSVS
jgi:tetratricopeptide (TPR) repeat protein